MKRNEKLDKMLLGSPFFRAEIPPERPSCQVVFPNCLFFKSTSKVSWVWGKFWVSHQIDLNVGRVTSTTVKTQDTYQWIAVYITMWCSVYISSSEQASRNCSQYFSYMYLLNATAQASGIHWRMERYVLLAPVLSCLPYPDFHHEAEIIIIM